MTRPRADRAGGRLVLVATPIGNLGDLSPRAVEALRAAVLVCCEDTRRTGRLLQHAGVAAPRLAVCNEHTERARIAEVLAALGDGGDVAVVTDAGTPGISDPGERLVRAAVDAGYEVTSVPGPTALVTALVTSGLATGRFAFEGFLPRSGSARRDRLAELATERRTIIVYEAPHRVLAHARRPRRRPRGGPAGRGGPGADQALGDGGARDVGHGRPRARRAAWRVRPRDRGRAGRVDAAGRRHDPRRPAHRARHRRHHPRRRQHRGPAAGRPQARRVRPRGDRVAPRAGTATLPDGSRPEPPEGGDHQ